MIPTSKYYRHIAMLFVLIRRLALYFEYSAMMKQRLLPVTLYSFRRVRSPQFVPFVSFELLELFLLSRSNSSNESTNTVMTPTLCDPQELILTHASLIYATEIDRIPCD